MLPRVRAFLLVAALSAAGVFVLFRSLRDGSLRTVPASGWYVLVCIAIDLVGVAIVATFHLLMRDLSPDDPRTRYVVAVDTSHAA